MGFCKDLSILRLISMVSIIIDIIKIAVPILMVVFIMIELAKVVMGNVSEQLEKSKKSIISKLLAGALVFLVPTVIEFCLNFFVDDSVLESDKYAPSLAQCFSYATNENINSIQSCIDSYGSLGVAYTDYCICSNFNGGNDDCDKYIRTTTPIDEVLQPHFDRYDTDPLELGDSANPKGTIPCKGERSVMNATLENKVNTAGKRTRGAAVAAAIYLATDIGYKIPYFHAGGHYHYSWDKGDAFLGISPQWGCMTKLSAGGTGKQKLGNKYKAGIDCTGYIAWILRNAGWSQKEVGSFSGSKAKTSFGGVSVPVVNFRGSTGKVKAGDVVWRTGHMGFVIKVNGSKVTIAHEKGADYGLVVETFNSDKGTGFSKVTLMDKFYNAG